MGLNSSSSTPRRQQGVCLKHSATAVCSRFSKTHWVPAPMAARAGEGDWSELSHKRASSPPPNTGCWEEQAFLSLPPKLRFQQVWWCPFAFRADQFSLASATPGSCFFTDVKPGHYKALMICGAWQFFPWNSNSRAHLDLCFIFLLLFTGTPVVVHRPLGLGRWQLSSTVPELHPPSWHRIAVQNHFRPVEKAFCLSACFFSTQYNKAHQN